MKTSAFVSLARYCAKRERSEAEVRKKAIALGMLPQEIKAALQKLKEEGYLNEARFVRAYISDQSKFQGWGPYKIKMHLRTFGISDEDIALAMGDVSPAYWLQLARQLIQKKLKTIANQAEKSKQQKLFVWLYGRGFPVEIIKQAMPPSWDADGLDIYETQDPFSD